MAEDEITKMLEGVQSALEKVKEKARSTFQSTEKEKEKEKESNIEKENKVGNSLKYVFLCFGRCVSCYVLYF